MQRIKGLPPSPIRATTRRREPDRQLPQAFDIGERLEIELLNVPDSDREGSYAVAVALKDLDGRVVKDFRPKPWPPRASADHTAVLPRGSGRACGSDSVVTVTSGGNRG